MSERGVLNLECAVKAIERRATSNPDRNPDGCVPLGSAAERRFQLPHCISSIEAKLADRGEST